MDLSIQMRVMYNAKHRYAVCLNFEDKLLNSLNKIVLEAKASVCTTVKKNLLLYCCKFLTFVFLSL